MESKYYVYILRCSDNSLYTGYTYDVERRVAVHNAGQGAKYTRSRRPVECVYFESFEGKSEAMRRESAIKKMSKKEKTNIIQKEIIMSKIPTVDEARALMSKYNEESFHRRHAETVSGVMRCFAEEYDPQNANYWAVVGMLHDVDYERFPAEHCVKCREILRDEGVDEGVIDSVVSHGWSMSGADVEPKHIMEKTLFAVDELTGLIGAVALVRPSKSVMDLELSSVKKKFKTPAFAVGCSREAIIKGAEMMGIELDELIEKTIIAMRRVEEET